jgi:photosystem II stability/assembly factor-like uncharacterized protein
MRPPILPLALLAFAGCDRVTSPSLRDAAADSLASLWEQVDAGVVNYNAVSGSAPDNVFIVGDQGTILHWDGTTLLPEPSGTTANLRGIAVPDPTLAFAVGEQGTILRRQDGVWTADLFPTTAVLNGVAARATAAVAVGEQGTILIYSAGAWTQATNPRTDNYYAVTDSSEGMLAVGALGIVVRVSLNGSIVSTSAIPGYTKVLAGAARFSAGAVLVGADGGYFYWTAATVTRLSGLPQEFMRAVSGVGSTVWMVGHHGLAARESGAVLLVPTPDDRWLLGVYAAAASDVWVVGRSGLILRGPPGERDGGVP